MEQRRSNEQPAPRSGYNRGFVGREPELGELARGLNEACAGHGIVYAVAGEPGIGKSWLAREFASRANQRGARVLWASPLYQPQAVAPPCWLWTTLSRDGAAAEAFCETWHTTTDGPVTAITDRAEGRELMARSPGALERVSELTVSTPCLFETTLKRLAALARTQPLVVVLDDLSAADRMSLLALDAITFQLSRIPIVMVAICREAEMCRAEAGTEPAGNRIFRGSRMLPLRALSAAELARMIEARTGCTPDVRGVEGVMQLTRGNPLFVELLLCEPGLARALTGELEGALPCAVAAAAEQHLLAVSKSTRDILAAAAVIGRDFDPATLGALADCPSAELLDALAEARAAGVLEAHDGATERYRFAHPLVWRALYDALPGSKRARLHHAAGCFIEKTFEYDHERGDQLARHFHQAILIGGAEKAVDYCCRAGDHAMGKSRFTTAKRFYAMALAAADLGTADEPRRCDLLLKAAAAYSAAGELVEAAEAYRQAAELAERCADAFRFAQAALGRAGFSVFACAEPDWECVALLTRALGMVGEHDGALRAKLLLRLAAELGWQEGTQARRCEMEREAKLIAKRTDDPKTEFAVLVHRHLFVHCAPEDIDTQLAGTRKMLKIALRGGRSEDCIAALACRYGAILRKGEAPPPPLLALAPAAKPVLEGCALQTGYRYYAAFRALLEGRLMEGASLVMSLLDRARAVGARSVSTLWPALILPFRELGRLAEIEPLAAQAMERCPRIILFRALAMNIDWLLGRREQACEEYEHLAARNFLDLPRDVGFLVCLAALAQVCAGIDDQRRAPLLYRLLEPHATMNAVFGSLAFFGPVSFHLGVLADVMEDPERAQGCFDAALGACRRLGARPWEGYVQHGWARVLERRAGAAGREKARRLAAEALAIADALKMADLAARLAELKVSAATTSEDRSVCEPDAAGTARSAFPVSECGNEAFAGGNQNGAAQNKSLAEPSPDVDDASDGDAPRSPGNPVSASEQEWVFAKEGDYWTLAFAGKVVRLKHARGLAYTAQLLDSPGREFYAADLVGSANNPGTSVARVTLPGAEDVQIRPIGQDNPGPLLDQRARTAYRRRLQELRCELDEAKSFNDSGRAAKIEEEFSLITRELARAAGLGAAGPRRFGSASERARINVTNAIRSLLQKLRKEHPELSRYLASTVRTGTLCSFQPGPRGEQSWRVSKRA